MILINSSTTTVVLARDQLRHPEPSMSNLKIHLTTFNCGLTPVDVDYFAAHLFDGLKTNLPPDLVVLSLQEIAPLGHSFLGGSLVKPYLSRFRDAVNAAAHQRFDDDGSYSNVVSTNLGMTALIVLARHETRDRIWWVETAGVGVGLAAMGNKGAAAARLGLGGDGDDEGETVLTFVAAHLAPMEWNWERRNRDWQDICRGLVFERDVKAKELRGRGSNAPESERLLSTEDGDIEVRQGSLFSPPSHVFFAGDLNYRTSDTAPKPDDHENWPHPSQFVSQAYDDMFKGDQLNREKNAGNTLHKLAEVNIDFPPTYKYSKAAQEDAARGVAKNLNADIIRSTSTPWAKHRAPAWCDRILFLAAAPPKIHSYSAGPVQPTSDHRPVSLSFSVPTKPLGLTEADAKPPYPVNADWKEARAAARRYEFIVGIAAYLALTWEGEALLAGSIVGVLGGYLVLRAMLGT